MGRPGAGRHLVAVVPAAARAGPAPDRGVSPRGAGHLPGRVLVRDSKDRTGGTLTFTPTAWRAFVVGQAQAVPQV
ncbi:hypothetical protein C8054_16900 [Micromonospora sp. RP3T]|nr:hypothetical protein C8054_16900 [Micromonospora sp. RP3T]